MENGLDYLVQSVKQEQPSPAGICDQANDENINGTTSSPKHSPCNGVSAEHSSSALSQVQPLDFSVRRENNPESTQNGHQTEPLDFSQEKPLKCDSPPDGYGLLKCDTGTTTAASEQTRGHELRQQMAVGDPGSPVAAMAKLAGPELLSPSMSLRCALPTMVPENRFHSEGKVTRPFKAYPKDVLSLPLGYYGIPGLAPITNLPTNGMDQSAIRPEELVSLYQDQVLKTQELLAAVSNGKRERAGRPPDLPNGSMYSVNPTSPTTSSSSSSPIASYQNITSPLMPNHASHNSRKRPRTLPEHMKDTAYWERRRKNNEAAKRSRDARRAKEDEIAIRAALLEQENLRLRVEVAALKTETTKLKGMLYST